MSNLPPVVVNLQVGGVREVQEALRSVEQSIERMDRRAGEGSRRRIRDVQDAARSAIDATRRIETTERKAAAIATKEAERALKEKIRADEAAVKAAEKGVAREIKAAQRLADEKGRQAERAARLAEAASRREAKTEEELAKYRLGMRQRYFKEEQAAAERSAKASSKFSGRLGGTAAKSAGALAAGIGKVATLATTLGGGFTIADAVQGENRSRQMAADVANAGRLGSGIDANGNTKVNYTADQVMNAAKPTALRYGYETTDVMAGMQAFAGQSGDLKQGMEAMPAITELARATGSNIEDLSRVAGDLIAKGVAQTGGQAVAMLRTFATQGGTGAVELKDLSAFGSRILAAGGRMGGDKAKNVTTAAALAQIARQTGSAGDAAIATTATEHLFGEVAGKKFTKRASEMGLKSQFDKDGNLRSMDDIIVEAVSASKGHQGKLQELFGMEGMKTVAGMSSIYSGAKLAAKSGGATDKDAEAAGVKAMRDEMAKFNETASAGTVTSMSSASMRERELEAEFARLKVAVGQELLPEFKRLIPVIRDASPHIVKLVGELVSLAEWIAQNPLKAGIAGLGATMGKAVAQEIALSGIKTILANGFGGKPGALASEVNPAGIAAPAVATGVATGAIVGNAMLKYQVGTEDAENMAAKVRAWTDGNHETGMSPEEAQKKLGEAHQRLNKSSALDMAGNLLASPFSESASKQYAQYKRDQGVVDNTSLQKALLQNSQRMQENTEAVLENTRSGGGGKGDPADPSRSGAPIGGGGRVIQ